MKNRGRSQKFRNYLRSELSKSNFQQQLYPLYYDNNHLLDEGSDKDNAISNNSFQVHDINISVDKSNHNNDINNDYCNNSNNNNEDYYMEYNDDAGNNSDNESKTNESIDDIDDESSYRSSEKSSISDSAEQLKTKDLYKSFSQKDFLDSFRTCYSFIPGFDIHEESIKYMKTLSRSDLSKGKKRKANINIDSSFSNSIQERQDDQYIQTKWDIFLKANRICNDDEIIIKINQFVMDNFGVALDNSNKKCYVNLEYFHRFTYDCCPNGCCVFVGENKNYIVCPICSCPRYYPCTKAQCKLKPYEDMCQSHPYLRKNKASISYRSIELLILELLKKKSFLEAIRHHDKSSFESGNSSSSYDRNMKEMEDKFNSFKLNYNNSAAEKVDRIVNVSLCISWFFDSFQIYFRRTSIFAPLIFTFQNLPPNLKNELGFGTFLLSFFTYHGGEVEKFLFYDCFIAELLMFLEGISVIHVEVDGTKTLYRVQMRVITHILDMPALCKFFNVENVFTSKFGCIFCNQGPGYYDDIIKKVKYHGTGRYIGMRSYLNTFSTMQQCCPYGWYKGKLTNEKEKIHNETKRKRTKVTKSQKEETGLSYPEQVLSHKGSAFNDLVLRIKWKDWSDKHNSDEVWCENETLHDNPLVLDYIRSQQDLKLFFCEIIRNESIRNDEIEKIISTSKDLHIKIKTEQRNKSSKSKSKEEETEFGYPEQVLSHKGSAFNDLVLRIKWKDWPDKYNSDEVWCKNETLHDNPLVLDYIRSQQDLNSFNCRINKNNNSSNAVIEMDQSKMVSNEPVESKNNEQEYFFNIGMIDQFNIDMIQTINKHKGTSYFDLILIIKIKNHSKLESIKWSENSSILHNNSVVFEYIKNQSDILKTPTNIVKKISEGYHQDQIYVEGLSLCFDPECTSKERESTYQRQKALKDFLSSNGNHDAPFVFINHDIIDINDPDQYFKLSDDIYCPWADYRPYEEFHKTTTKQFQYRSTQAWNLNCNRTRKKPYSYEGCKGHFSMLSLKNVSIKKDCGYEPGHILANGSKQTFGLWKGDKGHRQNLPGIIAYCKANDCHRCIWDNSYEKPWEFSKRSQMRVQNFLNCLIIPLGSKDRLKIVNGLIFNCTGNIKAMGYITLMKSLMNLILFANFTMRPSYKGLFRIFSMILCRLTVTNPIKSDFDVLFWRAVEFRTLWERLLPICEMTLVIHAIPETVKYVYNQKDIYRCWAWPGEKCHSTFKKYIHTIGSSRPELAAWEKYSVVENENIRKNYDMLDMFMLKLDKSNVSLDNQKSFRKLILNCFDYNNQSKQFIYDSKRVLIEQKKQISMKLNDYDYLEILRFLLNEILQFYQNDLYVCCNNSCAFRVLYMLIKRFDNNNHYESIFDFATKELRPNINSFICKINRENFNLDYIINEDLIKDYRILKSDIKTLDKILNLKNNFIISTHIWIGKYHFRGRGFAHSNKSNERLNDNLVNLFYKTSEINSWVKLNIKSTSTFQPVYALLNYSFNFTTNSNIIDCPYLQQCTISSVTPFKCKIQCHEKEAVYDKKYKYKYNHLDQVSESDGFHDSRIPYVNLVGDSFLVKQHANLPKFINSSKIFQTSVATLALHRDPKNNDGNYMYRTIKINNNNDKYFNDDMKVHYDKDVIALSDILCNPFYLMFFDDSPHNCLYPESESIQTEIRDMHQVWLDNKVVFNEKQEEYTNENVHKSEPPNSLYGCDNENANNNEDKEGEDKSIDKNSLEDETTLLASEISSFSINLQKTNHKNNSKMTKNKKYKNIRRMFRGFKWSQNSCALDTVVTIFCYILLSSEINIRSMLLGGTSSPEFSALIRIIIENDLASETTWSNVKGDIINWLYRNTTELSNARLGDVLSTYSIYHQFFQFNNNVDTVSESGDLYKVHYENSYICKNSDCKKNGVKEIRANISTVCLVSEDQNSFHGFHGVTIFPNVENLINKMFNSEHKYLEGDKRSQMCKTCRQKRYTCSSISHLPHLLVLSVGYRQPSGNYYRIIETIEETFQLSLNENVIKYKLQAAAIHGATVNGGTDHFTAVILNNFHDDNDVKYYKYDGIQDSGVFSSNSGNNIDIAINMKELDDKTLTPCLLFYTMI